MKKFKWITAISLVTLLIIISCKTRFATTKDSYTASPSMLASEHGKDLVYTICAGCHYNRSVNKFIGTELHDVPGIAGKVYSANLTHSKSHGVTSRYTDAELKYLFKTGIAKDGRFLAYMLRPNMADEDINDIIVYLRSDDPAVAAADTTVGLTHFTVIGKAYMSMHADPVPYKTGIKRPSDNNPVALGRYLVDNVGCFHCHSKSVVAINSENPEQTKGYLAGGTKLKSENGQFIYAPNITIDKNTGIGDWSKDEFRKAVKNGHAPNKELKAPMPKFQRLTDMEVDAIYAYLQIVPPKEHKVGL